MCERNRAADEKVLAFFAPSAPRVARLAYEQVFDHGGLRGRLRSSSYAPREGDPLHAPIFERLDAIFRMHQTDGRIQFPYETLVWYGPL